jgi:hypothetical protein
MATEKQLLANRENALQSTGPSTTEGRVIVAKNAVKHGIFTKDLIITCGDGKESEDEYRELLENLICSLNPQGQMEYLLAEKIAVDFWRLKRVLRFETGSIRKYLDMVIFDYYNKTECNGEKTNKSNADIDEEIAGLKQQISWNKRYIKCLCKGLVSFDNNSWEAKGLESNIEDDISIVLNEIYTDIMNDEAIERFENDEMNFEEQKRILSENGYGAKEISEILIKNFQKENASSAGKIRELEQQKNRNKLTEEVCVKVRSVPDSASAEKVMRYEKSIQKSILQNLIILKKLQAAG